MPTFPHPVYSRHVLQPAYADAQAFLFAPMLAAHEAHAIMLAECNIISHENAVAILQAVAQLEAATVDAFAYQPGVEDLFFRIEGAIIASVGADYGGNLQLARSRNDLGQALARMALREGLLAVAGDLLALRQVLLRRAERFINTLMPGYTHTQPAQPTTFAHYLAGVLTFLGKDQARLAAAYANVNESPLGAVAFTGTGFPIDRQRLAELLGFDALIASSHHSIGAGDHLTDVSFAVQSLAIGLGRMTKDLLFLATQEVGALRFDDSFIQISSIMPQKRNPVVLEHLRARLSRTLGAAQTIALQCHNIPYGDTQDIEDEILPPLQEALTTLQECLTLYTAVFETLQLEEEHLRQRAGVGFTTATELADTLVREARLPFRQAYKIVATMVQAAVQDGVSEEQLTLERLQAAATTVVGKPLPFSAEQLERALDPQMFVNARVDVGGVSPQATTLLLGQLQSALRVDLEWLAAAQTRLQGANALRREAVEMLLAL
ncbi:MAG: argininosuccinate lyase [Caldilineaceae bacterium]|nr:argininosuccinate lyase [Caldilineaceae bacterium]